MTLVHTEGESNKAPARQEWNARQSHAPSQELLRRDAAVFLHQSLSSPCVSAIAKAGGIWIEDTAGRRYMDFHGNSVHHIGYGHPRLKEAIRKQMDELPFSPRRFTCEPAVELAETLGRLAPGDLGKVLFTTGGSDAIEVSLKLARAATGRFKTLSFWDAFHGAGFGASSVGGEATFRSGIAGPLLPGTEHVAPWAPHNCPYGTNSLEDSARACANMIAYVLGREGDFAAFIAEPMRATPLVPAPGFWKAVREACDRYGTLLIFDEIPTGLGKTGKFFASEHDGVTPDIIVLGKSLGGGILPIASVIARRHLDVAGDYAIGHYTHEKNPVTARAALTTIAIIRDESLVERSAELGAYALARMQDLMQRSPFVGDVRGRGLMFGVEMVEDKASRTPARALAEKIYYRCLDEGLSFKISQGNVLTLSPPLVIARADLDRALDIVEAAVLAA
ncbi:aspartate aminotransferase family protein [Mesorhizobium sp. CA8]|uniref:(R)-1-hydroxy-2-aminoethylphosphonate ammonia-lyase n=1 Tax=unclassified Mesorhizobium TaxID=325217 RepID=UPI001CC991E0|nr:MULTISPECIES: aspartate aminotransferase family protein [unclassified Mesorhizobium]MBZ9762372.1 aspartate aminotransferase family protein [Mesorhizobium sp. CA8]MBZ9819943.1 aspartate aminotransferase family protein [Mesorhizobium sp. CA4]